MHSKTPAYLLDVYPHERRSSLIVWVKQHSAHKFEVPYFPVFCVKAETVSLQQAEAWLANDKRVKRTWRGRSRLWLNGPLHEVLRVQTTIQDMHRVATDLRKQAGVGLTFFDVDHRSESRWMHEYGLFPMCQLAHVPRTPQDMQIHPDEGRYRWRMVDPELRMIHLQVTGEDDVQSITLGDWECSVTDEKAALLELGSRLHALDPDVILTNDGDKHDVPLLLARIRHHGLQYQVWLGRAPDPLKADQREQSMHTYGRILYRPNAFYLRGRWHIDLKKKSLDTLDDRQDLWGILYMARLSNRRTQDICRNGPGFALQQMQIDLATSRGVALPWKRNLAEDWKDAATLCAVDRGGQIMNPPPGIYEDVAACDFSSYYPSIIVTHNLSSDTINCTCCPDGPVIPELNYHVCTKRDGHQVEVLRPTVLHRREVKTVLRRAKELGDIDDTTVAQANAVKNELKGLGVVCFGYFRYRNARFGCAEVHQGIQAYGRSGMTSAKIIAEEMGFDMVHMMTDCTFIKKYKVTQGEVRSYAQKVSRELGVPMDVEGIYDWLVLLPSKTHTTTSMVGVPNRYYGKFRDGSMKLRGIELRRHSTPPFLQQVQTDMLNVLAKANNAKQFLARIPAALDIAARAADDLKARRVSAKELALRMRTRVSVEEYRANTATKEAMRQLRAAGTEIQPGQSIQYILRRSQGPWPQRVVPLKLATNEDYDVKAYLKLLARSVETLLMPFGVTEQDVLNGFHGQAWVGRSAQIQLD